MKPHKVSPVLVGSDAQRALEIASEIGTRLTSTDRAAQLLDAEQSRFPEFVSRQSALSLESGHAGIALLHFALDSAFPEVGWRKHAHSHLARAASGTLTSPWLFTGWAGLLAVAKYGSRNGTHYKKLRRNLTIEISRVAARIIQTEIAATRFQRYELMNGIAGLCIALDDPTNDISHEFEKYSDLILDGDWLTPYRGESGQLEMVNNMGLAHGIAGVLAALNLIGRSAPADKAIVRISEWILARAEARLGRNIFPSVIVRGEPLPARTAWCYGTPGIAATVYASGFRLAAPETRSRAIAALHSLHHLDRGESGLNDYGLCHGIIGVGLCVSAVATSTGDPALLRLSRELFVSAINAFDPNLPLGYQTNILPGHSYDAPGFILGAAGIALGLLSATQFGDRSWLRLLGLQYP